MTLQAFVAKSPSTPVTAAWLNKLDFSTQERLVIHAVDSGVKNAYVLTPPAAGLDAVLAIGTLLAFKPLVTNDAASTISAFGSGAAAVINEVGTALTGGEINSAGNNLIRWTGTQWQLVNPDITVDKARTPAELAASVTPLIYAPTLQIDLERYGGGVGASAALNNAAMASAISVITQKGSGILVARGNGTYSFSNAFNLPTGFILQGDGFSTKLTYTGSGQFLSCPSNVSRVILRDLQLVGTGNTGTGFTLGDASGSPGLCEMRRVLLTKFATALRMGGATWFTAEKCEFGNPAGGLGVITNNVGIDFNYFSGSCYSSALTFRDCIVANNANSGVQATNVPVTMNDVSWINCNIQNNCQSTLANAQFYMGACSVFEINELYMEYLLGGTPPDALRTDILSNGAIRNFYINTSLNAIKDRLGGSMAAVEIEHGQIIATTTAAINCVNEVDVTARKLQIGSGTVTLTGLGCNYLPTGSGIASWPSTTATFPSSPTLTGSGGGPVTYGTQSGAYSKVGNIVNFNISIVTTALGGLTGPIQVNNLPFALENNHANPAIVYVEAAGITPVGGNNQFYGKIVAGSTSILITAGGTAAPSQVTAAALAAAITINITGSYQALS